MSQVPNIKFDRFMTTNDVVNTYQKCSKKNDKGECTNTCFSSPSSVKCGGNEWYYSSRSCGGLGQGQVYCSGASQKVCGYVPSPDTGYLSANFLPQEEYNSYLGGIQQFLSGGKKAGSSPTVECEYKSNFISTFTTNPALLTNFVNETGIKTQNPAEYRKLMYWYCSLSTRIADDPNCIGFCQDINNKDFCDSRMIAYCSIPANVGLQICSCLNSNVPTPSCFDAKCTRGAYQTAGQVDQSKNCSDSTICVQNINCYNSGTCNIDRNLFEQNCGSTNTAPPNPPNGGGDWIEFFATLKAFLIGSVIFLAVIFIAWLAFAIARSWSSSGSPSGGT